MPLPEPVVLYNDTGFGLTEAGLLNSESINVGISEFAMVTMACGLASRGHRVVCHAVTPHFLRAWEAVRTLLVPRGYDVVLVGNGEGQEYSSLGLSHQMGEQEMRGYCLAAGIPYLLACGRKELDAGLKMRGPLFVQYKKNPSMEV